MNSRVPGAHGPWPARCVRPSLPPPLSPPLLWLGAYTAYSLHPSLPRAPAQIQDSTSMSPQLPWPKLVLSPYGGTMSSSATKIAVSCRWGEAGDIPFDGQGQNHVTVSSKARIEANIHRGNITIATAPVPATRNRVRRLPLADAPYGEGPSDEGPSDGPPRRPDVPPRRRPDGPPQRRQRTLHSFLSSSPATSTRSDISTMPEREEIDLRDVNGEILIAERVFDL